MDATLRAFVRRRAASQCEYCRLPEEFSELRFHIEHIRPLQHGGGHNANNLALACPDCNLAKGPNLAAFDPDGERIVRLFNPRRDKWVAHFVYDGAYIVGKTAVRRASVALLKMNSVERVRVRLLAPEFRAIDN